MVWSALAVSVVLLVAVREVAAGGTRARCGEGRYLVQSGALVVGNVGAMHDTLTISPSEVTVAGSCGAAPLKRSGRRLRAKWPLCLALASEVRLRASLAADCNTMKGRITVQRTKSKQQFTATLSRCGDAIVDYGRGEECDDGNTVAGDGCEPGCIVPSRDVNGTITSTSVAGTILEQADVRVDVGNHGGRILFALTVRSPRFNLRNDKWHLVQGAIQVDVAAQPDAEHGVAQVTYDGISGSALGTSVQQGVTVNGAFAQFPPGFDLGRPFGVVYDFGTLTTCDHDGSVCRIDVP